MRNLVYSLLATVGVAACSDDGPPSPGDPAHFDRSMFRADALTAYSADDGAYVMGHAIGVYLLGKTLPAEVADHGYYYQPGVSAPHADVAYDWAGVMVARSGGSDGNGGALYDDVSIGGDEGEDCGIIEYDCEAFLAPAATRAGELAALVDPSRFAPPGADVARFSTVFETALRDAGAAEVSWLKQSLQAEGRCVD